MSTAGAKQGCRNRGLNGLRSVAVDEARYNDRFDKSMFDQDDK
jgi:hypothetical protein